MVDFQSRDTRRDLDDEDDEAEDADAPPDDAEGEEAHQDDGHDEHGEGQGDHGHGEHEAGQDQDDHGHDGHEHDAEHGDHGHDDHGHDAEHGDHGHDHDDHRQDDHGHDHDDHDHHHHHDVEALGTAVVTVSSSRTLDDDPAGDAIAAAMADAGEVVTRELVGDDHDTIQRTVDALANRDDVDVVVTTGGTGVTPDDVTVEAVRPLFEKELPGFGELFRILSHEEIGTKVVGTRATAGVVGANDEGYGSVPVFCLPGSENAARLGAERIISAEAAHLAGLAGRD
jgi:molybdenum cofactor biosynthesis protein B